MLIISLLEPVISYTREFERQPKMALLLDESLSMDKTEQEKSRRSRRDSLLSSKDFDQFQKNVDLTTYHFADELSEEYRVICIDLPGHGRSGVFSAIDTMAIMADAVKHVLDFLGIGRAVIIGHSMGGYATLAFEDFYPKVTIGFGLFHSHALAHTKDKKVNRDREIALV